jgi:hypothetical protein
LSKKIKIIVEERIVERHTCFAASWYEYDVFDLVKISGNAYKSTINVPSLLRWIVHSYWHPVWE